MSNAKTKIGLIGCGNISGIYFKMSKIFDFMEIAACADIDQERAKARAAEFGVAKACTVEELLADPEIEVVLNLTIPNAHGDVALAALESGKSVYNEKPLATKREDAKQMLALAEAKGLRVGGAPDTFLGGGLQTCRKLIDDGAIGRPVAATAFMMGFGPEGWHPNPDFFYQFGGGPMFDMGPYYLTALVSMLGPVSRVTGSAQISYPERVVGSGPKKGEKIKVNTATHIAGVMDFANGVVGTIITSFDIKAGANVPRIEIYGTEGSLSCPDPNTFGGPVRLHRDGEPEWKEVEIQHGYTENSRSVGLADMILAARSGRAHRANGKMAYHVLDLMHSFHDASREGKHIMMASTCERPAPLPLGLANGELDA